MTIHCQRHMRNTNQISIIAGGNVSVSLLSQMRDSDYIIGVDRGAYWLTKHSIIPDIALGDFDSVTSGEYRFVEKRVKKIIRYPSRKDATDLELAVEYAVKVNPKKVWIFGAIGTRFDHSWAGIQLLTRLSSHNIYGYIVDNFNEISIVRRSLTLFPSKKFRYVSIFPLHGSAEVTLTGFRYTVSHHVFRSDSTLGVSNEIIETSARIIVHRGTVILIRSRD